MHPRDLPIPSLKPGDKVVVVQPYPWLKADRIYTVEEVERRPHRGECYTLVKVEGNDSRHYIYRFALVNDVTSLEEML